MNIQYRTCSLCGANLDPDEKCTCETKREERIEDRPKPDTPQHQGIALLKHETKLHFIMEQKKMENLKGMNEAKSAIIRYKIFKMNYRDDHGRQDYKDANRFYEEFINNFGNLPQEDQEREWLFFKGFIAGIEDEERINHANK